MQVSLQHCSIGSHCVLQSGVKVGVRGFVFRPSDDGGLQQPKERQVSACGVYVDSSRGEGDERIQS